MESKVAVLLLNYNQSNMTLECVASVLNTDYPDFDIFVIDNGSKSEDRENLKNKLPGNIHFEIIEKNRGYVGGMNFALETASKHNPAYFLVMNNDTLIDPHAIKALVETSQKYQDHCIVTGKVYHFDQPSIIQHVGWEFTNKKMLKMRRIGDNVPDQGQFDQEMVMDMIDDIFWLLPAQVYKQVGGYSTYFWFNAEQADLALRAVKQGNKLIYTPNAKLWHKGSLSIGGRDNNPRLIYYNLYSHLLFLFLHITWYRFIWVFIVVKGHFILHLVKNIIKLIIGRKTNFLCTYAEFRAIISFVKWIILRNKNSGFNPF